MASIDPSLISDPKEQKWVAEISEILDHQIQIETATPPASIFQIPKSMTTQKPQAYEPQHIGLGPIHHFRPIPYKKMEQEKLAAVQSIVQCHKIKAFKRIVDEVQKLVPSVRASYDMFLQEGDVFLAWVFTIDGLFLLDLFYTYKDTLENPHKKNQLPREKQYDVGEEETVYTYSGCEGVGDKRVASTSGSPRKEDPKRRLFAQDVMMVENQIPFMVLKEIHKTLYPSPGNKFGKIFEYFRGRPSSNESDETDSSNESDDRSVLEIFRDRPSSDNPDQKISFSIFRKFCENHSPLELCEPILVPTHVQHVLDYMYYSIVNNYETVHMVGAGTPSSSNNNLPTSFISFFTRIQKDVKDEIVRLYKDTIAILETFTVNVTAIPSASVLHDKVGFSFENLNKHEGIQKIVIEGKQFFLPSVTLNSDSEVILRNLVAYEMLVTNSNNCPLTEYVRLMCELIVNVKDVKLLKEKEIIKGDLSEDDVVKLFIGIGSWLKNTKTKEKYEYLQKKRVEVKKVYESRLIMKAHLVLKKLALWLLAILRVIGGFVESSWRIVVFVIGIVTVFTLVRQAYCDAFGCDKKQVIKLLQYVSSL